MSEPVKFEFPHLFYDVLSRYEYYIYYPYRIRAAISKTEDIISVAFQRYRWNEEQLFTTCIKFVFCIINVESETAQLYQINHFGGALCDNKFGLFFNDGECFLKFTFFGKPHLRLNNTTTLNNLLLYLL